MATTTKTPFTPPRPDLYREGKTAAAAVLFLAALLVAWDLGADLLVQAEFPHPIPAAPGLGALLKPLWGIAALAGLSVWVRTVRYQRAVAAQLLYTELARVMGLPANVDASDRKVMRVHMRAGATPTDVTVCAPVDKAARAVGNATVRAVFAHATGADEGAVLVSSARHGVRVRADLDTTGPRNRATTAQPTDEPDEAPVPVVPPTTKIAERIQQALVGALDSDAAKVTVTETTRDGAPLEVWVEYPARMTSKVGDRLQAVRDTLARVVAPTNDEWTIRWSSHNDRIVLRDALDPLAPTVGLPPVNRDLDLYEGPILGVTETGEPFRLPLMGNGVAGTLVAGATGSGKGSILWNILRGVAPLVEAGLVRLWLCDPKGGMELGMLEGIAHRFAVTDEECIELLQDAHDSMKAKAALARVKFGRKVTTVSRDFPLDLVIIDELASLTDNRTIGRDVEELTSKIARQGRAPAVTLVSCTQDPRAKVIPNRSAYTQAVALRLSEAIETDMILGKGKRAQGALADLIPKAHAGIGYIVRDGVADPVRFRAAFVDDPDIDALTEHMRAAMRPAPPIGAPVVDTVQPPLDDPAPPAKAAPTRKPAAKKTPAKKPAPAPTGRGRASTVEQLARILDEDPLTVIFEGDPDAVTVTEIEESSEEGRWFVEFQYQGEGPRREEFAGDMPVTLLT